MAVHTGGILDGFVILGNHLFAPDRYLSGFIETPVFMCEDYGLCTHFKYHKHKIILFLSAMREYRDLLRESGFGVDYHQLERRDQKSFFDRVDSWVDDQNLNRLHVFEIEDHFFEKRFLEFAERKGLEVVVHQSPMFDVSRTEFQSYLESVKKPFMKTFYEKQRRQRQLLMTKSGHPLGGKFSFDNENRKKLPAKHMPPPLRFPEPGKHVKDVGHLVSRLFAEHPGELHNFWLPVTHGQASQWLKQFLDERLPCFGDFEDAISTRHDFVYHSVLTPMLNLGLLTPSQVLDDAFEVFHQSDRVPLNSMEGFVRQVIGWREFVRGIYHEFDEFQQSENFFDHQRRMTRHWYNGNTGVGPLDDCIKKAIHWGYNHHIERLMILSNMMLACELHPQQVYTWFMEMYVDSSDWVMGPNVFGMGQFSDGGLFATKPYTCGSNYILKMSDYGKGPWTTVVDGLFWRFIDRHREFYLSNPRMGFMVKTLDRMSAEKKEPLFKAAEQFIAKVTTSD